MVWDDLQGTRLVSADDGVEAGLFGILQCFKLLLGHVGGVEVGTLWTLAIARHEGLLAVETVPGAILEHGKCLHCRVAQRVERLSLLKAEILLPVEVVHNVGYLDKNGYELFFLIAEFAHVGGERKLGILVHLLLNFRRLFHCLGLLLLAAHGGKHRKCHHCYH